MAPDAVRKAIDRLARWGFAMLVGCGAIAAAAIARAADPPARIPGYALEAVAVYRFEVDAAVFLISYFGALMLALALRNRAFTEIGSGSLKAQDLGSSEQEEAIRDQGEILTGLMAMVERRHTGRSRDDSRDG
jgi:hypothetical protein